MPTDEALAERAVEQTLGRADRVYGHSPQALKQMLADADKALAIKLAAIQKKHGGPTGKFTEENAKLVRQQIQTAQKYVDQRLLGLTHGQATKAVALSVKDTVKLSKSLEKRFTGISKPLNLEQAAVMDPLVSGTNSSLLSRHKSSVQRYGQSMVADFERVIRTGFVEGMSNHEVIRRMVSTGAISGITALSLSSLEPAHFPKPTGYMRKQYWAERIVRTETAYAYNRANLDTLKAAQGSDFPDMQKKILATFDKRTAPDSIAVHGQIRDLDKNFRDGRGREYMHPPARPNDRETVIPWRPEWKELPNTVPTPPKRAALAEVEALPTAGMSGKKKWMALQAAIQAKKGEILQQQKKAAVAAADLKATVEAAQAAHKEGQGLAGSALAADAQVAADAKLAAAAKQAAQMKAIKEAQAKLEKAKGYQIAIAQKAKKEAMEKAAKVQAQKAKKLASAADDIKDAAKVMTADQWLSAKSVASIKNDFPAFLEAYRLKFGKVPISLKQGKNLGMWLVKYGKAMQGAEAFAGFTKLGKKLTKAQLLAKAKPSEKFKMVPASEVEAAGDWLDANAQSFYDAADRKGLADKIEKLHESDPEKLALVLGKDGALGNPHMAKAAQLLDAGDVKGAAKAYAQGVITDDDIAEALAKKEAIKKAAAEKAAKAAAETAAKEAAEKAAAAKIAEAKKKAADDVDLFDVMDGGQLEALASSAPEIWLGPEGVKAIKHDFQGFLKLYEQKMGKLPKSLAEGKNIKMFAANLGKKLKGAEAYQHVSKLGKISTLTKVKPSPTPAPAPTKAKKKDLPESIDDWLKQQKTYDKMGLLDAKESGGYVDIFNPKGEKITYFKKSGSNFNVDPPSGLGLEAKAFIEIEDAVDYALEVSAAIKAKAAMTAAEKEALQAAQDKLAAEKAAAAKLEAKKKDKVRNAELEAQRKQFAGKGKNPEYKELPQHKLPSDERGEDLDHAPITIEGKAIPDYRKIQERALDKMGRDSKSSVNKFTGSSYGPIRRSEVKLNVPRFEDLRKKSDYTLKPLAKRGTDAQRIANGLKAAKEEATRDQLLWRGIKNVHVDLVDDWLRTGTFDHIGTASTSRQKSTALGFGGISETKDGLMSAYSGPDRVSVLFKMKNKTAVPIEINSRFTTEYEVLAPAGVDYRVTNAYRAPGKGNVLIIEGEEL